MEFCKFYGVSAPQLVMHNLPNSKFKSVVEPLNNVIDYVMVVDLKVELEYLKGFIQSLKFEYLDPNTKRLERRLMKNLNRRKSGKEIPPKDFMTDEEIKEAESFLAQQTKTISIYQQKDGNEFYLTENEIKILEFYSNKIKLIERYINNIEEKTFVERKVFGKKLNYVAIGNGRDIMSRVSKGINNASKDKGLLKSLYSSYRNDINLLKSFIDENVSENDEKKPLAAITKLPDYIVGEDYTTMMSIISKNPSLKRNGIKNIETLYEMYCIVKSFDVEFYNRTFGLECSREEYEIMFDKLTDLGLVGLNFYCRDFFNLFVKSVTFAKEQEIIIAGDSELANAIRLIDRLLATDLRIGDVINA